MGLKKTGNTGSISNSSYKSSDYVKKATSSNEMAATVSSTGSAINGSYKIDVEQLAKGASFSSAKLTDGTEYEGGLTFEVNGNKVVVGEVGKKVTMDDIVKAINSTQATTVDGKIVRDDHNMTGIDESRKGKGSLGVTAFYDKTNGRLFMQTKETGEGLAIKLTAVNGSTGQTLVEAIEKEEKDIDNKIIDKHNPGQGAIIKFNGVSLTYSSNNINLNGLNIELKSENVSTTINVSTNTEGIMEKVEKLIKDYNDLIDQASKAVGEKVYAGYKPLTSEERKAMSESDVKLWDEKAKSGLLNRDETIERTLQSIRTDLYKTVEGLDKEFDHITKIGITTEKYARGSAGGKLQIDTDKLRKAIEKNPDGVMELLFKEPDKLDRNTLDEDGNSLYPEGEAGDKAYAVALRKHNKSNSGIFTGVYDNLIDGMKSIIDKSGPGQDADLFRGVKSSILIDFVTKKSSISDLDKSVSEMNRQIDNLNILLAKKENSYYAKFTAMEKAMHKMNGQSSWLAQQFG